MNLYLQTDIFVKETNNHQYLITRRVIPKLAKVASHIAKQNDTAGLFQVMKGLKIHYRTCVGILKTEITRRL
jgi:hypothetical protein